MGYDRKTYRMPLYAENTREGPVTSVVDYEEERALRDGYDRAWEHEHSARAHAEAGSGGSCVAAVLSGRAADMAEERHNPYHTGEVNSLRNRIEARESKVKADRLACGVLSPYTVARQSMQGRYLQSEYTQKPRAITGWVTQDHHY